MVGTGGRGCRHCREEQASGKQAQGAGGLTGSGVGIHGLNIESTHEQTQHTDAEILLQIGNEDGQEEIFNKKQRAKL